MEILERVLLYTLDKTQAVAKFFKERIHSAFFLIFTRIKHTFVALISCSTVCIQYLRNLGARHCITTFIFIANNIVHIMHVGQTLS